MNIIRAPFLALLIALSVGWVIGHYLWRLHDEMHLRHSYDASEANR